MKIKIEKGRMLNSSCHWIHFILRNTDITTILNRAPLSVSAVDDQNFIGKIFGVKVFLKVLGKKEPGPTGEIDIVADVRMPFGIGRTHTVAQYRYRLVDRNMTMVDLQFNLETTGIIMAVYASLLKRRIDSYLNQLMSHNEKAAIIVEDNDPLLERLLTEEQLERISKYRTKYEDIFAPEVKETKLDQTEIILEDERVWRNELTELTTLYQKFIGRTDELENELIRIRETRDAVATLLIARRMLEVIVAHICERSLKRSRGTEPLAGVIDKIGRAKCIPDYIITSMNNLNRLSTYGAHPKEFSPRQVREALIALCSIMEWYSSYFQGCVNSKTD